MYKSSISKSQKILDDLLIVIDTDERNLLKIGIEKLFINAEANGINIILG